MFVDGSRIDSLHALLVFLQCQGFLRFFTRHQPSGSVRGRIVPLRISFSDGENTAVTHIDRNQHSFSFVRCDCAFSEYHLVCVDIVMNRVERIGAGKAGSFQQDFRHFFPVPACKLLADLHVVQIGFQIFSGQIAEILRHLRFVRFPLQLF